MALESERLKKKEEFENFQKKRMQEKIKKEKIL